MILQSALELSRSETGGGGATLTAALSSLLNVGAELLFSSHSVQFTGLVLINKVMDVAVATSQLSDAQGAEQDACRAKRKRNSDRTTWKELMQQQEDRFSVGCATPDPGAGKGNALSQLLSQRIHARTALSLVLNAITLHRRVVDWRFRCTPSRRIRQCSYHCLQILSARVLLLLAQSDNSRTQLMEEVQLRMMVDALDYTLDPQLLCLVIQTVAMLSLHSPHHPTLLASGIPDALTQLVLPSDEWYYTNHTTRFSRVVKHHAARALVYLGLAPCLGPRVCIFDYQGDYYPFPFLF